MATELNLTSRSILAHIKELKECNVDFIVALRNDITKETLDLLQKYGVGCDLTGTVPGWWGGDGSNAGKFESRVPLEMYEKAAENGSHMACDYLGWLYMTGDMVPADTEKGLAYYRKAAELGNARSMMALGYAYLNGQGVEPDQAEALRWYEQAAMAGRADALQFIPKLKQE